MFAGSNTADVISGTVSVALVAFMGDTSGAYDSIIKWILGGQRKRGHHTNKQTNKQTNIHREKPLSPPQRETEKKSTSTSTSTPWVGHKICLKLVQVHVELALEAQRGRHRRHNLPNDSVEVGVAGALNVEVAVVFLKGGGTRREREKKKKKKK
jgi:hypothetical protein